jgi:protocatechuate 3,4-dioxygenase beta subunit
MGLPPKEVTMTDDDHIDENIRRLLSKTSPELQLPADARKRTLSALYELAARRAPQPPRRRRNMMAVTKLLRYAVVASIGVLLGILAVVGLPAISGHRPAAVAISDDSAAGTPHETAETPSPSPMPVAPATAPQTTAHAPTATPTHIASSTPAAAGVDAEALFKAGDSQGLISLLSDSSLETRLIAANYLSVLGDANAIPAMEAASKAFSGPEWANPYKKPLQILTYQRDRSIATAGGSRRNVPYMERPVDMPRLAIVQVVDAATRAPLADANVTAITQEYPSRRTIASGRTGPDGSCRLVLSDSRIWSFNIRVWRRGYAAVGTYANFSSPTGTLTRTVAMPHAMFVGGIVRTTDGQPLAGASVLVTASSRSTAEVDHRPSPIITGEDGAWSADSLVPEDATRIDVQVTHPVYVQVESPSGQPQDMDLFEKGLWPTAMVKGISISGTVLDPSGRPAPAAKVQVAQWYPSAKPLEATADQAGAFTIPLCRPGKTTLTAKADPYIENTVTVTTDVDKADIQIQLLAPQVLLGKVVDPEGNPIADANVWPTQGYWGGRQGQWQTTTDGLGRFRWDGAPPRESFMEFSKTGFMTTVRKLTPSDTEQTIILSREFIVSGRVTDAATGQLVKHFMVGLSMHVGNDSLSYDQATLPADGTYAIVAHHQGEKYSLWLQAEGYNPPQSATLPAPKDGRVVYDVALTRRSEPNYVSLSGTVYLPDGSPAAGAQVAASSRSNPVHLRNGRILRDMGLPITIVKTAEDGSFSLPKVQAPGAIVAIHDQGFGIISDSNLAATPRIDLTRWGAVDGIIYLNGKPLANKRLSFNRTYMSGESPFSTSGLTWTPMHELLTDSQGRFRCDRVFPGTYGPGVQDETVYRPADRAFTVVAGETAHVVLGNKDARAVTATIERPDGLPVGIRWQDARASLDGVENFDCVVAADTAASRVPFPWPAGFDAMSFTEAVKWYRDGFTSPQAVAYRKALGEQRKTLMAGRKSIKLQTAVDETGELRLTDSVPGSYILKVAFYDAARSDDPNLIAIGSCELTIPALPRDPNQTTSLGTLKLDMLLLTTGHPMPPLKLVSLDGKETDLTSFRGKYLLLNFWPTMVSSLPHEALEPTLRASKQYASDPRIRIINVTANTRAPEPALFAKFLPQHGLADGYLIPTSPDNFRTSEAIQAVGSACSILISPDGMVIAARNLYGMHPSPIEADIAAALAP